VTRFSFDLPAGQTLRRPAQSIATFSRDGRMAAYNTDSGIYARPMDAEQVQLIAGTTQEDLGCVALSPDGQWVAFYDFERRQLKRTSVAGGASSLIAERSVPPVGLNWDADDTMLFGGPEGILRVAATGGTPAVIIAAQEGERLREPSLLPDGRSVLFTATKGGWSESKIVVASLPAGDRTEVVARGASARYVPSGHLIYTVDQTLFGQAFDVNRRTTSGAAVSLVQNIYRENALSTASDYSLSSDGTLMYVTGGAQLRSFVWVDRQGHVVGSFESASQLQQPRISPDGSQVAYSAVGDIWTWTFSTGTRTGLTNDNDSQWNVLWNPDSRILFDSGTGDFDRRILRRTADGSGSAEVVTTPPAGFPDAVSPDGKFLIFHTNPRVAMVQPLDRTAAPRPLVSSEKGESSDVEFSPDGRWVAYESNASGRFEVYVRPFPDVEAKRIQISPAGGQHPAWSRDGKELFFLAADGKFMATRVTLGNTLSHDAPVPLFPAGQYWVNVARNYDVSRDGKQFLFVRVADQVAVRFHVVRNWIEELKRLVPTK
jgi:serine/threonine-protein kinase